MFHNSNKTGFKTRQLSQHPSIAASGECLVLKHCLSIYFVSMMSKGDLLVLVTTSHLQLID